MTATMAPVERGVVRRARRPAGWLAPGPLPAGPGERADGWPAPDEDLCYLCGEWRIFQKLRGHRFSLDDLATAWFALDTLGARRVERALDIGCGSGSVLMMIAWARSEARLVGVEAQDVSAALARRSIAWNGASERCEVRHGDLRDPARVPEGAVFDLVTGTPPYIPLGDGVVSSKVQRGPACFEIRGGIDDYAAAAARTLAPGGLFVVCHSHPERVSAAAERAGLAVRAARAVVPREGRDPLFSLFALERAESAALPRAEPPPLVVRDRSGQWTDDFRALRHTMGMPA